MQCVFTPSLVTFKTYFLFQNFDYNILQCGFSLSWFFLGFIKIVGLVDFWYSSKVQQFAYYIFKYFSSFFLISEILYIYLILSSHRLPLLCPFYFSLFSLFASHCSVSITMSSSLWSFLLLCLLCLYFHPAYFFLFRCFSIYSSFICLLETFYCSIIFMFSLLLWSYFFIAVSNSFVF